MADIAKFAGVSISTVSRALNGHKSIPQATRDRILQIAREHKYQLNSQARNFRLQRTQTIAAVVPFGKHSHRQVSDPFYTEMLGAIIDELAEKDYGLLISRVRGYSESWYQDFFQSKRYDGLIILAREQKDPRIAMLSGTGVPFVVWGAPLPGQEYVSVGYSGTLGIQKAVRHLVSLGRQKIGFIGGNEFLTDTSLRIGGYRKGLLEAEIPFDDRFVSYSDYTAESGCAAAVQLLKARPELDSLIICSDLMAVSVINVLGSLGYRVPEDIAVVGYDDIYIASYCKPKLTTLRQDIRKSAGLLVEKLYSIMNGQPTSGTTLQEELIIRESSGAQPVK